MLLFFILDGSGIQQLQPSRDCCEGVLAFNWIWSGKSLYWSCCISCASALRAASWNACSTLMASLALDSNDAMPPFKLHHWCSCFVVTFHSRHATKNINEDKFQNSRQRTWPSLPRPKTQASSSRPRTYASQMSKPMPRTLYPQELFKDFYKLKVSPLITLFCINYTSFTSPFNAATKPCCN